MVPSLSLAFLLSCCEVLLLCCAEGAPGIAGISRSSSFFSLRIDTLAFDRKKYLAIVDFQFIHEEETDYAITFEHLLELIKNKYESLKGRVSSKFYDETQFFSQQMLFVRFDDEAIVMKDLFPAFK